MNKETPTSSKRETTEQTIAAIKERLRAMNIEGMTFTEHHSGTEVLIKYFTKLNYASLLTAYEAHSHGKEGGEKFVENAIVRGMFPDAVIDNGPRNIWVFSHVKGKPRPGIFVGPELPEEYSYQDTEDRRIDTL